MNDIGVVIKKLPEKGVTKKKNVTFWPFGMLLQELIRRWDSERELFHDDIVGLHVEASAYTPIEPTS